MYDPDKKYPEEIPSVVGGWNFRPTSSRRDFYEEGRVFGFATSQDPSQPRRFMKMQRGKRRPSIQRELQNYEALQGLVCYLPAIIDHGNEDEWSYIVLDYLGRDLSLLLKQYSSVSNSYWVLDIVIGMFSRLCEIHEAGFVHGNIKPGNFIFCENSLEVSIIDFETLERPPVPKTRSNPMWASQYSLRHESLSYRDDLISLAYCMVDFFRNGLPWMEEDMDDREYLADIKDETTVDDLCAPPFPPPLKRFVEHVFSLDHSTSPDYLYLYHCLAEAREQPLVLKSSM